MTKTDRTGAINYQKVRLSWCRARLLGLLRKWGIYILTGAAVLGVSGSDPVATMTGTISLSILPLVWGLQQSIWVCSLVAAGYAAVGALLLLGMSPLLWPPAWRDIELSLPISRSDKVRSDLLVVAIALAPFFLLCVAGLLKWMAATAHATPAVQFLIALAILLVAIVVSAAAGLGMLSAKRRPMKARARRLSEDRVSDLSGRCRNFRTFQAIFLMPLIRGPARRAMRLLQLSPLLLLSHLLLFRHPAQAAWWLGLLAVMLQLLTTRLTSVLQDDLEPLHASCISLPLNPRLLRLARRALALMPTTISLALVAPILFSCVPNLRVLVAVLYVTVVWGANVMEVFLGSHTQHESHIKPTTRVSLWLAMVVLQIAFASEITT